MRQRPVTGLCLSVGCPGTQSDVQPLGQTIKEPFGIQCGHAAGARCRHGLAEHMILYITSREDAGQRQTVCAATSPDLITWTKVENLPVVAADPRWYGTLEGGYPYEAFRDPWVFKMAGETGWTMLVTSELKDSVHPRQRAAMAMAKSDDLINWTLLPATSKPDQGFAEAEVFQQSRCCCKTSCTPRNPGLRTGMNGARVVAGI